MNKEKRALNIFISNELYDSLKEFSFNNDDSMARTVSKALKQYMNIEIERPLVIPKIETLTGLPDIQRTSTTLTATGESISKINLSTPTIVSQKQLGEKYSKKAEDFYKKYEDILGSSQEDYIKTLIDSLEDESIQYIHDHFRRDIKAFMDMNNLKHYKCDFEEWFTGYQAPEDWKYKKL